MVPTEKRSNSSKDGGEHTEGPDSTTLSESLDKPGPSISYSLFECPECSTMVLGVHDESPALSCHAQAMTPIEEDGLERADPNLDLLLNKVYEMPRMAMNMCHFIFEAGMASVSDTAEHFGYDRSTVSRYLSELADSGFVEKHTLNREDGGIVNVYRAKGLEETRRAELVSFLRWSGTASMVLDEANEIKAQCVEDEDGGLDQIFWDVYERQRAL